MDINEFNNLETDNLATNSLDVTNFNPSDELDVGENNYDYGESLYAKNKRTKKIIKVVATTFAIGVTGLLGGTLITDLFKNSTEEEAKEEEKAEDHQEEENVDKTDEQKEESFFVEINDELFTYVK